MRTFYSLPNDYSGTIQEEIHQLIYHTDGGYTWYHLYYDMPVQFRKFHLRKTQEMKEKEAEQMENGGSSSSSNIPRSSPPSSSDFPDSSEVPDSFRKEAKKAKKKASTPSSNSKSSTKVPNSSDSPSDFDIPDDIPKSGDFGDLDTSKANPDVSVPSPDNE